MEQIMAFMAKVMAFFQSAHVDAYIVFILMAIEYWLGKTEMVKPGSSLEAILMGIKKVIDFVKGILGKKA